MAVNDFQDQEEIENFKHFWRKYGRWAFYVLLLAAAGYLGWVLYQGHQREQNDKASVVFETSINQSRAHNEAAAKQALLTLQQDFGNTLPAAQATLLMAGTDFDAAKYDDAAKHLQWVQKRQKDELLQAITAQRLAVVYLQQQKYDDALKALDAKVSDDLKPVLLETRGDVLVAQGKPKEAAAAYAAALKLLPEDVPQRELLQMKADPLS